MGKHEYILIEEDNAKDLTAQVNKKIVDGWTIVGGASASLSETDESQYYVVTQAMKKIDGSDLKTWVQVVGIGLLLGAVIQVGIKLADWSIPDPPREPLRVEFTTEGDFDS
jgi:hypothetical protein